MSRIKNIAIIGANGFIGKHLSEVLNKNHSLNIYLFGKEEINENTQKNYQRINLTDASSIQKQFLNIDVIYYLTSASIPASSWENPLFEIEQNLIPFVSFTECIAQLNVKKIIFISSGGTIYGPSVEHVREDSNKLPFSPHGIIKLTIEYFLNYFEKKYNLKYDVYRLSNAYGPGQNTSKGLGVINTFIEKIITDKKITIFGNGENIRNYIYIDDVCLLLSKSLEYDINQSNVFNLSSDVTLSINDIISVIRKSIPESFDIVHNKQRQSDNSVIHLDNSKLLKINPDFKFTPIERGILNTYNYIKKTLNK